METQIRKVDQISWLAHWLFASFAQDGNGLIRFEQIREQPTRNGLGADRTPG